ncbi:MAG TPA: hypothetical protein VIG38_04465 [Hyphomicrobium sp.]|jgi:hypothetical protein
MVQFHTVSMRLDQVLLVGLVLLISALQAQSAEVGPGASPGCQLKLEGPIEAGDSEKLSVAFDKFRTEDSIFSSNVSLCLNSLGGNYDEALKLITIVLKRMNVTTVVDKGAECYSACAFLFLAGNAQRSEDGELAPDRTLDVRATLGFHAPYLESDTTEATMLNFRRGVNAIAKLLEIDRRELFPRGLLAKALQVEPHSLLYVDTIEKAGVWSINLKGYKPPTALTARMLDQACRNKDMWTNFSHTVLGRPADDPETLHGLRQSDFPEIRGSDEPINLSQGRYRQALDMFGYEATKMCIVDVFSGEKNGLFLSLTMVPTEEEAPKPELLGAQIMASQDNRQTLDVLTTPLWYVFSPDTTLMSLGRINVLSETSAPL